MNRKIGDSYYVNLIKIASFNDALTQESYLKAINLSQSDVIETMAHVKSYMKYHYRLLPIIVTNLRKFDLFHHVVPNIQQFLIKENQLAVVMRLGLDTQLNSIVSLFIKHEIPMMLLKGSAFNHDLYGDNTFRAANDIDILVKSSDWEKSKKVINNVMNYTAKEMPGVLDDSYELTFSPKTQIGASLDLHQCLVQKGLFNIDEVDLWQTSDKHPHFKHELVRSLSPEYSLIHQAMHAFKDMNFIKYNLLDSFLLLKNKEIDHALLSTQAKKCGAGRVLFFLLHHVKKYMPDLQENIELKGIKPNFIIIFLAKRLLRSPYRQPFNKVKTYRYRLNQILSQFVFLDSASNVLRFQKAYLHAVHTSKFSS